MGLAEASWFAVPSLEGLDDDVHVVHIVRHPLLCIRSLLARWLPRGRNGQFSGAWRWASMFEPEIADHPSALDRVIAYWGAWNDRIERSQRVRDRWHLEDVTLQQVCDTASDAGWQPVGADLPGRRNETKRRSKLEAVEVSWADLQRHPLVMELADRYGYGPDPSAPRWSDRPTS